MAIIISYDTSISGPKGVWTPNFVTLSNDEPAEYFDVDVSYNGNLKQLRLYTNADNQSYFNIHNLLQDSFESDVKRDVTNDVIQWEFSVEVLETGGRLTSISTDSSNWVINGTKNKYDNYLISSSNYTTLQTYDKKPLFLNDQKITNIYWDDDLYNNLGSVMSNELEIYWLNGTYRNGSSDITNLEIISYTEDSSSSVIIDVSLGGNNINSFDCNPYKLKNTYDVSINNNTKYLIIKDSSGYSEELKVEIQPVNDRNDKYFRLTWLNANGVPISYNFNYNYLRTIDTDKENFKQLNSNFNEITKQFNTKGEEYISLSSDYMSEEESRMLESLWTSPSVKITAYHTKEEYYNDEYVNDKLIKDIYCIVDIRSMDIKRRRNGLINYSFDVMLADMYYTQLF